MLMRPQTEVGIVGYGAYVPRYRLPAAEVNRIWHDGEDAVPVLEKSVPGPDEDTVTMSIEAARNALARAGIDPRLLGAVWVGSESHPYAVKPTSTIVAEAIGAVPNTLGADWQFACKAGTEALQASVALVGSQMARYALAIGMDTAQGRPGDALEYTAAAGGAAYILGQADECVAVLEGSCSYISETPDFWRRPGSRYPEHAGRFTGEPAYFKHLEASTRGLLEALEYTPADFDHVVFHQPNLRFPVRAARNLGFARAQIASASCRPPSGRARAAMPLSGG
jgi:hydroxymethylglutaryl-CoA synthase